MRSPIGTLTLLAALAAPPGCNDSCVIEGEERLNDAMDRIETVFRLGVKSPPDGSNSFYVAASSEDVVTTIATHNGQVAQCAKLTEDVGLDDDGTLVHRHRQVCAIAPSDSMDAPKEISAESTFDTTNVFFTGPNAADNAGVDLGTKFCHQEACAATCLDAVDDVYSRTRKLIIDNQSP